jgi:exocyst complex component 2
MHHVLKQYVTPKAESQLTEIYNKISEAYVRRPGDENLQQELEGVKKTLSDTRKATGIDFLCFRGLTKKSEGTSSKSERTRERRDRDGRERQERSGRDGRREREGRERRNQV